MVPIEQLEAAHADYRSAVEHARDENASPEAKLNAQNDIIAKRHALDELLIQDKRERDDDERNAGIEQARAAAARLAAGVVPVQTSIFNSDDLRALASGKIHNLSYRVPVPKATTTVLTTSDTTAYFSYSVPQEWSAMVEKFAVAQSGVLRAGPKILNTATGVQINYPVLSTDMTSAAVSQGAAPTNSTYPAYTTVPLNSYDLKAFVPVSEELLRDSIFNIEQEIRELAARSLGAALAPYLGDIDTGTGSGAPAAITVGVTNGKTCASQTVVTMDEAKELYYSVLPEYRAVGKWIANSAVTLAFAIAKQGDGGYLWQPSVAAGEPDVFMGKPWFEDSFFDASASGNIPLVFGDINRGYLVRFIGDVEIDFSRDFLFTNWAITCRFKRSFDAAGIDTIAVKAATLA